MFPISIDYKTKGRKTKGPAFVTGFLLLANFAVFFWQLQLGEQLGFFIDEFSLIPQRLWHLENPNGLGYLYPLRSLVTSAFLHGGVLHILGNMLMLWVFGRGVENRLGHLGFLLFYLMAGVISGLGHAAFMPQSTVPCVGASGAIAGVMGAGLVLFPRARVATLIPFFVIIRLVKLPAFVFLIIWFAGQVLLTLQSPPAGEAQIAVMAHIVGFVYGLLGVLLFLPKAPKRKPRKKV